MKKMILLLGMLLTPLILTACGPYGPMHRWGGEDGYLYGFGYGYGGMFMGIIIVIVLVVAAYFIVSALRAKNSEGQTQETPLDILKKRYAKGEITKEEFERMKSDLQ